MITQIANYLNFHNYLYFEGYNTEVEGHPFEVIIKPVPISLPTSSKVVHVSAGRSHTLALTADGQVFSMGNNSYGQCGRNIIEDETSFIINTGNA